jgi:hypothetical protein
MAAIAAAAVAVKALHEEGRAHGDVRPGSIWSGPDGISLLTPAQPVDGAALLSARLREGASPIAVAFAAPEVASGGPQTPASDVYGLAAAAYWTLCGEAPLGRKGPGQVTKGIPSRAAQTLTAGLRSAPDERPTISDLAAALAAAAEALIDLPEPVARVDGEPAPVKADGTQMSALLIMVLILGGSFVFCGALGLVIAGWGTLNGAVQFLLLGGFTGGIWGGGVLLERRGFSRSGFTLVILGSQLLWVNLAHLLDLSDLDDSGPWAIGAAAISALVFWVAVRRDSAVFGVFTAIGFMVSLVALGDYLSSGSEYGALVFTTGVALVYAAGAALGHRLARRPAVLGIPLAVGATLWVWVAGITSLVVLEHRPWRNGAYVVKTVFEMALETGWLYGLAVLALAIGWKLSAKSVRVYRILAFVAGGVTLAFGPTLQAMIENKSLPHLLWVVALGLGILAAAFRVKPIAEEFGLQLSAVIVGLFQALAAPFVVCLDRCFDRNGMTLLEEALKSVGRVYETRFVYLSIPLGTSLGLVALGFLFSRDATRKASYRMLEVAGLVNFFALTTLLSLPDADDEFFYISLILAGTVGSIALGVWGRRAMHVAIASSALLLNLFIQYFAKLSEEIHWGLLALGFGIALLLLAILYERKIRHLLPKLKEWA